MNQTVVNSPKERAVFRWTPFHWLLMLVISTSAIIVTPILVGVWPFLIKANEVTWAPAAYDFRPRALVEGEMVSTLANPFSRTAMGSRQYEHKFEKPENTRGWAVMVSPAPRTTRTFINAYQIQNRFLHTFSQTSVAEVPKLGFQKGLNKLHVVVPKSDAYQWPRAVVWGPAGTLNTVAERMAQFVWWSSAAQISLCLLGAALAFAVAAISSKARWMFAPALMSGMLAANGFLHWSLPEAWPLELWPWLTNFMASNLAISIFALLAADREHWPALTTWSIRATALGAIAVAASGVALSRVPELALVTSHWIGTATTIWASLYALAMTVVWQTGTLSKFPALRIAVALFTLSLLIFALVRADLTGSGGFLALSLFQLAIGTAAAIVWCGWVALTFYSEMEVSLQKYLGLSRIIREQEVQLKQKQEALEREIVERAILQERARLSRDIHDGVGGSLVSLMVQARTGDLTSADFEQGLQQTLTDLRLMIDALDHAGAGLETAFSTFQTRIAPVFAAAGIKLEWEQQDLSFSRFDQPATLLNTFRIMQEACTNIFKHARANSVKVKIEREPGTMLKVQIQDDGSGAVSPQIEGHGLENMKNRAKRIGAQIEMGPSPGGQGWKVSLSVPLANA